MSLIKCPECGKDVSEFARCCPKCGYPIEKKESEFKQTELTENIVSDNVVKNGEKILKNNRFERKKNYKKWIVLVGIGIVALLLIVLFLNRGVGLSENEKYAEGIVRDYQNMVGSANEIRLYGDIVVIEDTNGEESHTYTFFNVILDGDSDISRIYYYDGEYVCDLNDDSYGDLTEDEWGIRFAGTAYNLLYYSEGSDSEQFDNCDVVSGEEIGKNLNIYYVSSDDEE